MIFHPAERGQDHSLKPYFRSIEAGMEKFTTEPYISLASGHLCITVVFQFKSSQGQKMILCVDVST